jgi:putative transposase
MSITMEAAFCVATLQDAMARHGRPEIFNTDQGSQFTGSAFTSVLADAGIAISMDGKGGLAGQRVRRTAVAQRQIRGGLSARLRQRQRGPHIDRQIPRLLERPTSAFEP